MPLNIPNLLTWGRILLIPLFVGVFYAPHDWLTPHEQNLAATIIFVAAAITEGQVELCVTARHRGEYTSRNEAFAGEDADRIEHDVAAG